MATNSDSEPEFSQRLIRVQINQHPDHKKYSSKSSQRCKTYMNLGKLHRRKRSKWIGKGKIISESDWQCNSFEQKD